LEGGQEMKKNTRQNVSILCDLTIGSGFQSACKYSDIDELDLAAQERIKRGLKKLNINSSKIVRRNGIEN